MNQKPDIDDYRIGGKMHWDRYEFDLYQWKIEKGIELKDSEKSFLSLYKQKKKNNGLRDSEKKLLKCDERFSKKIEKSEKRIDLICNLIEIVIPIFAYQIFRTAKNAVQKINKK